MKSQVINDFDIWSNVDYIGLFIIIIIGILVSILLIWLFYRFNKSTSNVMNKLSLKYNGEIIKGDAISGQQTGLTFRYNEFIITISSAYRSKSEISYTQVAAAFSPNKDINIYLFSKSILNYFKQWLKIAETLKLEKIETGFSDFDKIFTVKSNDFSSVHSILTMSIKDNLRKFKKYNPNVFINEGLIKILCPFVFNREQDYNEILNIVFLFCDRVKELDLIKK